MQTYRVTWDSGDKLRHGEVQADSPSEAWTRAVMQCLPFERVNFVVELEQPHSADPLVSSSDSGEN